MDIILSQFIAATPGCNSVLCLLSPKEFWSTSLTALFSVSSLWVVSTGTRLSGVVGFRWASRWHAEQPRTQFLLKHLAWHWLLQLPHAELLVQNKAVSHSNIQKVLENIGHFLVLRWTELASIRSSPQLHILLTHSCVQDSGFIEPLITLSFADTWLLRGVAG